MADLWNEERPLTECAPDIDVPAWIADDISPSDIAAILQGGCARGAYMPAVTYRKALATMAEHGDDVLDYVQGAIGEAGPGRRTTRPGPASPSFISHMPSSFGPDRSRTRLRRP
jgi:hypothetical protein